MPRHYRTPDEFDAHQINATRHAVKRAWERLGLPLNENDVFEDGCLIFTGQSRLIGMGAARRELHELSTGNGPYYAVWDSQLRCIVTYLKRLDEWKGGLNAIGHRLQLRENKRDAKAKLKKLPTTEKPDVPPIVSQ